MSMIFYINFVKNKTLVSAPVILFMIACSCYYTVSSIYLFK
nr:MAG TPA: hypothetical protein [Caudoviricetes sp.]